MVLYQYHGGVGGRVAISREEGYDRRTGCTAELFIAYQSLHQLQHQTLLNKRNEMVSAGDTDISLHIRPGPISNLVLGGGVFWGSQNSKYS